MIGCTCYETRLEDLSSRSPVFARTTARANPRQIVTVGVIPGPDAHHGPLTHCGCVVTTIKWPSGHFMGGFQKLDISKWLQDRMESESADLVSRARRGNATLIGVVQRAYRTGYVTVYFDMPRVLAGSVRQTSEEALIQGEFASDAANQCFGVLWTNPASSKLVVDASARKNWHLVYANFRDSRTHHLGLSA